MDDQFLLIVNAPLCAQRYLLKEGTAVDAALIAALSSMKKQSSERAPELHQVKKGNQRHFDMKGYIGVDADSSLAHFVVDMGPTSAMSRELAPRCVARTPT
ncbi:hypothetical protein PCE31107_03803 [Pandoraea cepalis]|uniref:Transposase n=1 Tax=Pandoraea cepalis TaxID=2508294 RepID=A0A5E4XC22_9BURK|nr:hypothetical protein PCE31107_03803 [Pandoraea cepalis]